MYGKSRIARTVFPVKVAQLRFRLQEGQAVAYLFMTVLKSFMFVLYGTHEKGRSCI